MSTDTTSRHRRTNDEDDVMNFMFNDDEQANVGYSFIQGEQLKGDFIEPHDLLLCFI